MASGVSSERPSAAARPVMRRTSSSSGTSSSRMWFSRCPRSPSLRSTSSAAQAELVDRRLGERGQRLNHILLLDVPEEELVRRMTGRAAAEGRSDDTPEAIKTRFHVYQRDTAPLIAHYAQRGIVHRVPGTGAVDDIAGEIRRIIGR